VILGEADVDRERARLMKAEDIILGEAVVDGTQAENCRF